MPLPVYSTDQIADQLVRGYWQSKNGGDWRAFDVGPGGTIEVNLTALNATGATLARAALEAWENVIDVQFDEVGSGGDLTFSHNSGGAIGGHSYSGNTITSAYVRVSTNWFNNANGSDIGDYSMQTFMHEIGHALGLGHAGDYDGGASYGTSNHFLNDSWQMTVMSYFNQAENTWVDADRAVAATLMAADIVAAQDLYGASQALAGNTVYGANSNVGGTLEALFDAAFNQGAADTENAFTLYDAGGIDRLNLKYETADQRIDLNAEGISDVGGLSGNLIIARDTVIEEAWGGWGRDEIIGNEANNRINGGRDRDHLTGADGNDKIYGRSGNDFLAGDAGRDYLKGGTGHDEIHGGNNNDTIHGQVGDDSLFGGRNRDKLYGGDGDDTLDGGIGSDTLSGDDGADVFVFNHGKDVITDFENDVDTLWLPEAIWGGGLSVLEIIETYAAPVSGGTRFDFQNGMTLGLDDLPDAGLLLDDIVFI